MNILDKDTVKTRILPKLSIGKRGKKCSESVLIGLVEFAYYQYQVDASSATERAKYDALVWDGLKESNAWKGKSDSEQKTLSKTRENLIKSLPQNCQ